MLFSCLDKNCVALKIKPASSPTPKVGLFWVPSENHLNCDSDLCSYGLQLGFVFAGLARNEKNLL